MKIELLKYAAWVRNTSSDLRFLRDLLEKEDKLTIGMRSDIAKWLTCFDRDCLQGEFETDENWLKRLSRLNWHEVSELIHKLSETK